MVETDTILRDLVRNAVDNCISIVRNNFHEAQDTEFDVGYETFRSEVIRAFLLLKASI